MSHSTTMSSLPTFNESKEGKDGAKIEWARFSWNPVTGCLHNCKYCYARDIAKRFYKQGFKPTFHEDRLIAPYNTRQPEEIDDLSDKNVFTCSMADLFGEWVPQEWIDKILKVCANTPHWNYIFLTKNPKRLLSIEWPHNAWVGTTVDVKSRLKPAQEVFRKLKAPVKFVSFEPMDENMGIPDLSMFDWIIVGGKSRSSGERESQPEWKWVENLILASRKARCRLYLKPNLLVRPREFPKVK